VRVDFERLTTLTMIILLLLLGVLGFGTMKVLEEKNKDIDAHLDNIELMLHEVEKQQSELEMMLDQRYDTELQDTIDKLEKWLDIWEIDSYEATGYAPFESAGSCHDGDPNTTATGTRPAAGTVAVDPAVIPYGTVLWVQGYG